MSRDEFSRQTIEALAKRVGVRCSNPGCGRQTAGPRSGPDEVVNIGVGAHITAAALGGPRYNSNLSPEDRQSIENGIWLCQNCAKLVDNDPARYSERTLRSWKESAEHSAITELEKRTPRESAASMAELVLGYREVRIQSFRHDYLLTAFVVNNGSSPLGPYHVDVEMPAAVVWQPENQLLYVPNRSSTDVAYFRVDSAIHRRREIIYPGDKQLVMSIEYFMDTATFQKRSELFTKSVHATLYQHGLSPIVLAKPFSALQVF